MLIKIINKKDIKPLEDPCGQIRELYHSKNLSIAHDTVFADAQKHKHKIMEEIYYVDKGKGKVVIDEETYDIKEGDIIPIPKNTWHYLKKLDDEPLEVLVITHPKYLPEDLILYEE